MSRPGKFAKSSRVKQLRQFKRRKHQQAGDTIPWEQVTDFLLGRYQLTRGRQQPPVVAATVQRFLSEWLAVAQAAGETQVQWDLTAVTQATLKRIGNQVPWQFYAVLAPQLLPWQHFLQKEGPAVPLASRRQLVMPFTAATSQQLIAEQLAVNLLTVTATPITATQRQQLVTSLLAQGQVQWSAVAGLFAPLGFQVTAGSDTTTRQWLNELRALTVSDFHN
ncbi:hypothetical protein [Levilactobacillus suantsaii]|uniref:Uncharacterized protein n=1 Tax=Levilactobacillus suantsaii TaxID=2292255 RepID=A0A4Q0VID2_9LACO|nr:hypothetical protein [Levilactobacillus suantsaii]QMU08889.1 hypothetical protein H3M12_04370 [Levilactobacillus suantsaii]RXI76148.1 hypothetical protein DXH47_10835 [Levilactobacillus suantsaii]